MRPGDDALADAVNRFKIQSSQCKVVTVIPENPPPDMKASLQAGLQHLEQNYAPTADDAFLVAPADMPGLSTAIVNRLIERHIAGARRQVFAPTIYGRRGHPTLFSWPLASEVFALAAHEGLNAIVERHSPAFVPCEDLLAKGEDPFADIDTPVQYQQMTKDN